MVDIYLHGLHRFCNFLQFILKIDISVYECLDGVVVVVVSLRDLVRNTYT